jgi:hypothetical protein
MGLWGFISKLFKVETEFEEEIINGIDVEQVHQNKDVAIDVVKRIQKISNDNLSYLPEYKAVIEEITTLEKVDGLPSSVIKELELMSHNYAEGMLKKESFKKVVNKEHPDIVYLEQYKDDINKVIQGLKRIEENQRIVKRDLDMLEGEKADIYYKRERYGKALDVTKILLILTAIGAVIGVVIFCILIYIEVAILLPASITFGILFAVGIYIYIFRRYLIYEIKKSIKLDKRAVTLTNKTKIKYVNNQQYLDYAYEKYRVNSCEMLELRFENLQKLNRNKERYKRLNSNIGALLDDIAYLLNQYNIGNPRYIVDHLDYFSSDKSRALLFRGLNERREEYLRLIKKNEKEIKFMFGILKDVDPDITMEEIMRLT